ncbi:uncharacterized protein MONOS_2884 [Monocercomonoides exilis]|uniref:uncharacterized protein n=1 Tax=Monocercomonoides exilis TaxID=2049356 RepID=UPI0035596EB4|nr:hypothetical protein MONOS_2884 [Monocercomonoides exilis]|eukprot:MONOS_2884.1-p1 / transcript=MONOS_2884.1 / gene=MONOS_2884 / organism=Monocercomonoides_exilis_PA203 / gene_product=unspecified product / transcript_product=unspecified product / location=Mono_scaffold00062:146159-147335(+) / protein_length=312 / sequence_SO=supercontig / SO=protein_coding / is_pseudo=false
MSSLHLRIEKMIAEEEKKKEGENEKLLVDLCECYLMLRNNASSELISICVPRLLKVAMNRKENEETQKDVEMALLALNRIDIYVQIEQEPYMNELKEIMKNHQEHRNLTRLAYQCTWQFLICRFFNDKSLEEVIVNELHLAREARRELEELMKCIDWGRGKEEKRVTETKEAFTILSLLGIFEFYFSLCTIRKEEFVGLINSIVQIFRAAKDNHREIGSQCVNILRRAVGYRTAGVDGLLKGGAVEAFLEEIQRPTMDDEMVHHISMFFKEISIRCKKEERKDMKKKVFEKMEEEGYEDTITSIHEIFESL